MFFFVLPLTHGAQRIEPSEMWEPQHVWVWWWHLASRWTTHFYIDRSIQIVHLWACVFIEDSQIIHWGLWPLQCQQGYPVGTLKYLFPHYTYTVYKYFTIVWQRTNIYICIIWSHIKQIYIYAISCILTVIQINCATDLYDLRSRAYSVFSNRWCVVQQFSTCRL